MSNFIIDLTEEYIPIDLHCHSRCSDGAYTVHDVLHMVYENGGKYIALTDHDTVEGIDDAIKYSKDFNLSLIPGVEISVSWDNNTVLHILGLNIDHKNQDLVNNLDQLRSSRFERGQKIADKLAKIGILNALDGALSFCDNPNALSRTHFAKWLVSRGYVNVASKAFEKYLAYGKPAYVNQQWASLGDAINWIKNSGGIAVIAHPCRYKLTRTKLLRLIDEFKYFGGIGIEVISSSHNEEQSDYITGIALSNGLLASVGNDFHSLDNYHKARVGICKNLPKRANHIFKNLNILTN